MLWLAGVAGIVAVAALVGGLALFSRYEQRAEAFDLSRIGDVEEQSAIFDANGDPYGEFGDENRVVVPLSAVSKNFLNALLAREDRRFWQHDGVDYRGIVRAMMANLKAGRTTQGASTITQQLAKNACALEGRTLDRKVLEAMLARRIEKKFSKQEILELYVNRIYFGTGFYGIETASRGYFGKPAKDLSVAEGAVLAALIRSPSKLSPVRDAEAARAERDTVIDRMVEMKSLTPEQATAAKATLINLDPGQKVVARDSNFDAVMEELHNTLSPEVLKAGGLKVYITIDPQLQAQAERAVDRNLTQVENQKGYSHPRKKDFVPAAEGEPEKKTDYLQGALVAIENDTGAIRAAVGARDYAQSKYSRALSSRRPVGSTFKPFVYAAAFDRGLLPGTLVDDSRIAPGELGKVSKNWSPENSDDEYNGPQPAAVGLLKSRNTMTVRVGEAAGLSTVRELGRKAGLNDHIPDFPVVFLGAFECTLRDLTAAYTVFPNLGKMPPPHLISKVVDAKGNTLFTAPSEQRQVLDPGATWLVSSILQEVMKSGTAAKSSKLGWHKPAGGKTGTTNDYFDAWFVGYTSSVTCGVWVGFDQPQTIGDKAYGSAMALPIWVDFMKGVPEGKYPCRPFENRVDLTQVKLCQVSGRKATPACIEQGLAYDSTIPTSLAPTKNCETHVAAAPQVAYADTVPSASAAAPAVAPAPVAPPVTVAPPVAAVPVRQQSPPAFQVNRYGAETGSKSEPTPLNTPQRSVAAQTVPPPVAAVATPLPVVRRDSVPVSTVQNLPPPEAAAPDVPRRIVTQNGTKFEVPVAKPVSQQQPVQREERPRARGLFSIFGNDNEGKSEEAPAEQAPPPVDQASTQSGTPGAPQPNVRVERRGNQTITTTVIEVRKARPASRD